MPMTVTEEPFLQFPQRQTAAGVLAGAPGAQHAQVHLAPWNEDGAVVEHSPQPQPWGWACMRTEHAPQRQPAQWDRAESADEHEGQEHERS